jgi:hypothetical protein
MIRAYEDMFQYRSYATVKDIFFLKILTLRVLHDLHKGLSFKYSKLRKCDESENSHFFFTFRNNCQSLLKICKAYEKSVKFPFELDCVYVF